MQLRVWLMGGAKKISYNGGILLFLGTGNSSCPQGFHCDSSDTYISLLWKVCCIVSVELLMLQRDTGIYLSFSNVPIPNERRKETL